MPVHHVLLRGLRSRSPLVCQVPLRHFFTLPEGTLLEAAPEVVTSNSSEFFYVNSHIHASEMNRLRMTDFEPFFESYNKLVVRCTGAVW